VAVKKLVGANSQVGLFQTAMATWGQEGIDTTELFTCMMREREELTRGMTRRQQSGPFPGLVLPTLRRCGLLNEQTAMRYHELFKHAQGADRVGNSLEEFLERIPGLPADTAAWVLSEID
jgi:hypothetical protein